LSLFYGDIGYANAYQYYDVTYMACHVEIFIAALLRVLFVLYIALNNMDV